MTVQALNEYRQELRQAEEAEPNRLKDTSMPTPPWLDSPDTAAAASNMLQPPWASVDEPMPRADVALKGTVDAFDRNRTHFLDAVMNVRACHGNWPELAEKCHQSSMNLPRKCHQSPLKLHGISRSCHGYFMKVQRKCHFVNYGS